MKLFVLDIGGTSIKAASWSDGRLSAVKEFRTEARLGGRHVMNTITGILDSAGEFDGIGISSAGQIDCEKGVVLYANENMPSWSGMEIGPAMERRFHVPVTVENDVNAAALGEGVYGAAAGYDTYLCLTYGTGVGGAIVMDHKIFRGAVGAAGEVGSMITHGAQSGRYEAAGGHYEDYASAKALIERVQMIAPSIGNGRQLFESLEEPGIREAVDEWIWEISHGIVSLIHIFNPQCIVLGGGVMNQEYVTDRLRRVTVPRIMPCFQGISIRKAQLGNAAGLWGMVYLSLQKQKIPED